MFRTELTVEPSQSKIQLNSKVLTIGSCFSTTMGSKLEENKFEILNNPFGTTYNPISICNLLNWALDGTAPKEDHFLERDGVWFHHDFHSDMWATTKASLKEKLKAQLQLVQQALQDCDWLILTLGTAIVYQKSNQIVANCHKVPQKAFEKTILSPKPIFKSFESFLSKLKIQDSKSKILLTVSPVRHIKDTIPTNSLSKSILILVANELARQNEEVHYFPSYELMMDDLRDYRFYKEDLIHPTAMAENYIWEKFVESYFNDAAQTFISKWAQIRKDLSHKPFQPESTAHQQFLKKLLQKLENLSKQVNVAKEIESVKSQIK